MADSSAIKFPSRVPANTMPPALAITHNGKLVYARGFGYSDVEKKELVKPDALFRIASVSKPITAVAVMQLVEKGKLKLDDKVTNFINLKPYIAPGAMADPNRRYAGGNVER